MVAYQDFVALCQSGDSEERGRAAHLAAVAYLRHTGPADEHAALYAALIGFLDDPSVKVRAALAYGLLHAREAPRPILLALLQDSAVIARAVAQYSLALLEVDLVGLAARGGEDVLDALAMRETISTRLAETILARARRATLLKLIARPDVRLSASIVHELSRSSAGDAKLRGALLARKDLPPVSRLLLVEAAAAAVAKTRIVSGAIDPGRLARLLRNCTDSALTAIGETQSGGGEPAFAAGVVGEARISTRVMLHAVINGHVLFFADCIAALSETRREKVFSLLRTGGRQALNALLARAGLSESTRNLIVRLICHARNADLADDVTARHFVVTALTEELIVEHEGAIPAELEDAFSYLSEQNVALARRAARGVMPAFAEEADAGRSMPLDGPEELLALAAA